MRFRALLFDLDGTLVDSHHEICLALNEALIDVGFQLSFARVEQLVDGSPLERIWAQLSEDDPDTKTREFQRFAESYRDHYTRDLGHKTAPFPGVVDTLKQLKARASDARFAVVSNKNTKTVRPLLEAVGMDGYFDLALGSGGTSLAPKPSPALLLHAAETFGFAPEECAMIGDTVFDVIAGKSANMRTFALTYGMSARAQLVEAEADHLVDHFHELLPLLSRASPSDSPG